MISVRAESMRRGALLPHGFTGVESVPLLSRCVEEVVGEIVGEIVEEIAEETIEGITIEGITIGSGPCEGSSDLT